MNGKSAGSGETERGLLDFTADAGTVKKSAVHSVLIQLLFRLKGIITMPVITYYVSPAELGAFNIVLVTASMLVPLFSLNLTDGPAIHLVQERSKSRIQEMYNTVTNGALLSLLVFLSLFWVCMRAFAGDSYKYTPLIALLLFSNFLYKLATYILVIFQKTAVVLRNTICRDGAAAVLSIALVIAGYSVFGMVAALAVTNLAAAAWIYTTTRRELRYAFVVDRDILARFLKTALPLLPVSFFSWVIQSSDSYFLAYYHGQESVGKYSVIYGLAGVILSLTFALNFFWFPVSARLWVANREKYRKAFISIFAGFTTILFLFICLFELNSRFIMELIVRKAAYHDAYVITGIIAFAFAMQVLITLLTAPLYSNGNTKTIFFTYFFGGLINTALNVLLIPPTGIIGAAISTAVSYLAVVVLMAWMNYRMAGFAFFDRRLVAVTLVFVAAWGGVAWLRDSLRLSQLLLVNGVVLAGAAALLYGKVLKSEEKRYLAGMYHDLRLKMGGAQLG